MVIGMAGYSLSGVNHVSKPDFTVFQDDEHYGFTRVQSQPGRGLVLQCVSMCFRGLVLQCVRIDVLPHLPRLVIKARCAW